MIQLKKHLVTASYVDESMLKLDEAAKSAGITILGEMGLDPGIGICSFHPSKSKYVCIIVFLKMGFDTH